MRVEPLPVVDENNQPELDICSWCKEHAMFVLDGDGRDLRSECCDALPISVDVELEDR